jgi:hypothetical protein
MQHVVSYFGVKAIIASRGIKDVAARSRQLQSLGEECVTKTSCREEDRVKVFVAIGFQEAFFKYVNKGEKEKVRITIWLWRT